jgi:hypothetical protein
MDRHPFNHGVPNDAQGNPNFFDSLSWPPQNSQLRQEGGLTSGMDRQADVSGAVSFMPM